MTPPDRGQLPDRPARADVLSVLLDYAFSALFDISEAPNRGDEDVTALAVRAREALAHIESNDPDKACSRCKHVRADHAERSGLCGADECQCEGFAHD